MNWNEKAFLRLNILVGKNRWLDAFGLAGAEWVFFAMVGWYVAISFIISFGNIRTMWLPIASLGLAGLVGWILNVLIGMVVKQVRPRLRYPEIKILFWPFSNWKSFPSDHAMFSFLIFFFALIFNLPTAWSLLILALWVCFGRVYAGMHYPLDILGGAGLAALLSIISYFVLHYFIFI